jgi:hypothetical protein
MFKLQINFDRHNAGLKFSYFLRFDLPNFSLPSTLKGPVQTDYIWLKVVPLEMPCLEHQTPYDVDLEISKETQISNQLKHESM